MDEIRIMSLLNIFAFRKRGFRQAEASAFSQKMPQHCVLADREPVSRRQGKFVIVTVIKPIAHDFILDAVDETSAIS